MIEREDGAEVEFARAVAREEPAAVARFERELLAKIPAALARMKLDAATVDEVTQRVRERLLLPAEGEREPRLVGYAGQGRLEWLVLVTASRIALDLMRSRAGAEAHDGQPAAHSRRPRPGTTIIEKYGASIASSRAASGVTFSSRIVPRST